jgi:surfeit locus 1 family protein
MKHFSPGVWPTMIAVPVVLILLALSVWQVTRYSWKTDLLDRLEAQLNLAPVPLPGGDMDAEEWGYRRVTLSGHFLHDREIHLFAHADKGVKGFQIITPFVRTGGEGVALVNRGFVPVYLKAADSRKEGLVTGNVTISGIVRKPWGKS